MNDKTPFAGFDISKFISDFKVPGFDAETLMNAQKKNIESLADANEKLFKGFQEITKLQSDMMRSAVQTVQEEAATFSEASSPQEIMEKQTEIAKRAMEAALENMQRLADETAKATGGAAEAVNKQFLANLDEIKTPAKK